ncbi:MAG TPA: hypothetical protein VF720_01010 [Candidatus Eisenbacteria bacterium]
MKIRLLAMALALCTVCHATKALALDPYDAPSISCVSATENSLTLKLCAGNSGAPAGLTIHWMTLEAYEANGNTWFSSDDPRLCKISLSGQPSLQHPGASRWELGSNGCEELTIGDINFDETGVSGQDCGLDPLECGTDYVFSAFAHAGRRMGRSDWSATTVCRTADCPAEDCTYTQGFWKTHGPAPCLTGNNSNVWPVGGLTLGTVNYTAVQLCAILQKPAAGNALVSMAHQLIAAKLNTLTGATCATAAAKIAGADAAIGARVIPPIGTGSLTNSQTSSFTGALTTFNEGAMSTCPAHCGDEIGFHPAGDGVAPSTWGDIKSRYIGKADQAE